MLRKRAGCMLKFGHDRAQERDQLLSSGGNNLSRVRAVRSALLTSSRQSQARLLSDDEMRTQAWLDRRLGEIAAREAVADSLQKQCEQQLALLSRKEALERTRSSLGASVASLGAGASSSRPTHQPAADSSQAGLGLGLSSSRPTHQPTADSSQTMSGTTGTNLQTTLALPLDAGSGPMEACDGREEFDLQELQDQINALESQLEARQGRIVDLRQLLDGVDGAAGGGAGASVGGAEKAVDNPNPNPNPVEKAVEHLRRSATTLPQAHDIIR